MAEAIKTLAFALTFAALLMFSRTTRAADDAPHTNDARAAIADGVWASADGSKVTYESRYFEAYQVVTAADMLRWVPGGAELLPSGPGNRDNESDKRGFGSGGDQVLINGKRLSGKSNDIASAMQRIQASIVSRVEVIRGTAAGLDVRSEGTLINVVLSEGISGGSGAWQAHSAFYGRSEPDFDGLLSYSDSLGRLNYLLSAQYGPYNRGNEVDRVERFFDPVTGALIERREIDFPMLESALVLNASGDWHFGNGDVLNVNARFADTGNDENETTRVFFPGNAGAELVRNILAEDGIEWELGGDLEQRMGRGTLHTRAIYTRETGDESERISLSSTVPGNVPAESQVESDEIAIEAIVRTSYSWPLANGQELEVGIEGAQNTLQKGVRLFEVEDDGSLTPIVLFNSDSDVTEDRYEVFSTHFWQLRSDLVLESALNVEYSTISQEGVDVENSRSFTYVKPRFDLRWDLTEVTQLRGSLERTVTQLDFGDFVANFDNEDDQVDAGNPDLEPEKAWELKLTWERRLANDSGVLEAQVFYSDVEDHIDNIRVTDSISAAGNIGDAEYYGVTLKGSWRLAAIGLEGAVLDTTATLQDSGTTDPFTGRSREMSERREREYSLNFRHDVARWRLNYNIEVDWNGEQHANDINFRETSTAVEPRAHLGIQYRLTERILLWYEGRVIVGGKERRTRDRFVGDIADDNLLRHEIRDHRFVPEHIVGLRGQF